MPDLPGRGTSCVEWGESGVESQEVCPTCGHYALHHTLYRCTECDPGPRRRGRSTTPDDEPTIVRTIVLRDPGLPTARLFLMSDGTLRWDMKPLNTEADHD